MQQNPIGFFVPQDQYLPKFHKSLEYRGLKVTAQWKSLLSVFGW